MCEQDLTIGDGAPKDEALESKDEVLESKDEAPKDEALEDSACRVASGDDAPTTLEAKESPTPKAKAKPKATKAGSSRKRGVRNREYGRRGEDAAARYLFRRGYEIVARNWTCRAGEVDIIARTDDAIVFVEVKTRKDTSKGLPSEAVDARKRKKYEDIAISFLRDYDACNIRVRFDVISLVQIAPDRALVRHHIDAFGAA